MTPSEQSNIDGPELISSGPRIRAQEAEQSDNRPFQQAMLGLEFEPTVAMKDGRQRVWQCRDCGTLVIQSRPTTIGRCPTCDCKDWWHEAIPARGSRDSLVGCRI